MSVYFGGSRSLKSDPSILHVVSAVIASGQRVHVGCQFGADRLVIQAAQSIEPGALHVFSVSTPAESPSWVNQCSCVRYLAGGPASIPTPARFLRRSIAAFQGCSPAVFFQPGPGSFAVMREFISQYPAAPVLVFGQQPAPMFGGSFVPSLFFGLLCLKFQPQATQTALL